MPGVLPVVPPVKLHEEVPGLRREGFLMTNVSDSLREVLLVEHSELLTDVIEGERRVVGHEVPGG